ncbi:MAG: hypothetical protein WC584_05405 [Candidatus Pacearchaeota archaeon]
MITQKRIQITIVIFIGLAIMNILSVSAITGSIGNARMILYPEVNGWTTTTIEKTILVKNTNNVSVNISLKMDENSSKFIEIIDKEFVLEPNTEKKAQFIIKVKKEGKYEGKINVFFSPVEGKEAGVVLPSTIIVVASKESKYNEKENNSDETNNANAPITENATGSSKISPVIIISFVSTLILLGVLVFLIYFLKSKKKKIEKKRNDKTKKSENEKIKKEEKKYEN